METWNTQLEWESPSRQARRYPKPWPAGNRARIAVRPQVIQQVAARMLMFEIDASVNGVRTGFAFR